ncbi:MAG: beta-ketoacyl-ACP synthase II [Tyzzerella sp.]|uniref:3-oxoacyl-[acyl-carrier-protein] synthase 2 n=1 Tax=Candidatus Fimicola merdigallinarum TaxID=2840819 RepID=A0A9D9DWS2_9FIRM|nr:beta-ketoacyl-ACP synthase II [Candidatus Fimicola merdigallinarum]
MNRRVVVTGMGAVTPVGNNVNDFWNSLKNGVSGIDFIKGFDTSEFKVKIAAEVKDFDPTQYVQKKELKRNDKVSIYGIAAASQAVEDSKLNLDEIDKDRFGVIVGSGIGGMITIQEQVGKLFTKGPSKVSPLFIPMAISNMVAGNIAIKFGARGICENVVTACATGTNCIGDAFRNIKHGYSDVIIAGGAEASITEIGLAGFTNLTALSSNNDPKKACRPFDKNRDGFVMGDGSGVVILEELEHALKRGAKIYGEVVGYGATGDAYHMTAPSPDGSGAGKAMKLAMAEAGITPSDVSYINAHGTSTPANETSEIKAINYALGDEAVNVPVSSTKSMTGHLLGAAGAIEAIACIKALEEGFIPPTLNVDEKDESCNFDCVPYVGRSADLKYALSNSLGFGGHNAVLCFKKWEG